LSPTPPTARRRGLRATGFAVVLGAAIGLTGCQVTNTPENYVTESQGTVVQTNFVDACTGNIPSESSTTTVIAPKSKCECMYQIFVNNVPFDDNDKKNNPKYANWGDSPTFTSLENDLRTDPGAINKLPQDIQDMLRNDCGEQQTVGTVAR